MKAMGTAVSAVGRVREPGDTAPPARTSPLPIWLAALVEARCQVIRDGEDHAVRWSCVSGRAQYTNAGADAELIRPLGVQLEGGQTLAVCWLPGETDYTVEVYRQDEMCA